MDRVDAIARRHRFHCDIPLVECDGHNEYTITVEGTKAAAVALVKLLEDDEMLHAVQLLGEDEDGGYLIVLHAAGELFLQ
jgi:hypothetical protein